MKRSKKITIILISNGCYYPENTALDRDQLNLCYFANRKLYSVVKSLHGVILLFSSLRARGVGRDKSGPFKVTIVFWCKIGFVFRCSCKWTTWPSLESYSENDFAEYVYMEKVDGVLDAKLNKAIVLFNRKWNSELCLFFCWNVGGWGLSSK